MTKHAEFFAALAAPFKRHEVKTLKKGKTISYVTARTVMNRLDEVVGPENWWDDYFPHENSVICRLTIVLPDGKEITKVDAGGYAGMSDSGDDDKSGFSDAFKRAAVKFGVSRYLYEDGVPNFGQERAATPEPRTPARETASRPAERQEPRQAPQANGTAPATTKEAHRFETHLNAYCQRMNAAWLDKHTGPGGEIPAWVKDIISPFQVVNHMLKAAGITLPAGGNFNERMKAAAKLWLANEAGVTAEWNAYLKTLADDLHRKHAESAEPVAVGATREPGSDDE